MKIFDEVSVNVDGMILSAEECEWILRGDRKIHVPSSVTICRHGIKMNPMIYDRLLSKKEMRKQAEMTLDTWLTQFIIRHDIEVPLETFVYEMDDDYSSGSNWSILARSKERWSGWVKKEAYEKVWTYVEGVEVIKL